jgi:hypothetical protein
VEVTGPRSAVEQLREEGVTVSVDLKGLGEGYYILSPKIDEEAYGGFTIMSEAASVTLTDISYNEEDEAEDATEDESISGVGEAEDDENDGDGREVEG